MSVRLTVRLGAAGHAVTLYDAREALSLARARDVNDVAFFEYLSAEAFANGVVGRIVDLKFSQEP